MGQISKSLKSVVVGNEKWLLFCHRSIIHIKHCACLPSFTFSVLIGYVSAPGKSEKVRCLWRCMLWLWRVAVSTMMATLRNAVCYWNFLVPHANMYIYTAPLCRVVTLLILCKGHYWAQVSSDCSFFLLQHPSSC